MSSFAIRSIGQEDRLRVAALVEELWGSRLVVTRVRVHDASAVPGFLAFDGNDIVGLLTLRVEGGECEILTLDALVPGKGIGRALLEAGFQYARGLGCSRVWLITTNNNLNAIAFYQKCGMRMVAIHLDAVTQARALKPQIPLVDDNGLPIRDEVEFEVQV
jgi:GNAT superfamily N-acetyltransferase